jgi:hypothetical protein
MNLCVAERPQQEEMVELMELVEVRPVELETELVELVELVEPEVVNLLRFCLTKTAMLFRLRLNPKKPTSASGFCPVLVS